MKTVLESLGYFIVRNGIKKETVAIHYGRMIKRFFIFYNQRVLEMRRYLNFLAERIKVLLIIR